MHEEIEPWIEQYRRLKAGHKAFPSRFPEQLRRSQEQYLEMTVKPADDGHVYIDGYQPKDLSDAQLRVAGRDVYRRNIGKLEECVERLANRKPRMRDSFALLFETQEFRNANEQVNLDDVFEILDRKLKMLSPQEQRAVLEKYDFMVDPEYRRQIDNQSIYF